MRSNIMKRLLCMIMVVALLSAYAVPAYAADDVTVTRQFYDFNAASGSVMMDGGVKTFTLEPNSRHYAIPIPKTEIANAGGALQQNTY